MNKAIETIYFGDSLTMEIGVSIKKANGEVNYSKYVNQYGYITMRFNPSSYMTIYAAKSEEKLIVPKNDYYVFLDKLITFFRGFATPDLYVIDEFGKLMLNEDIAKPFRDFYTAWENKVDMAYTVIKFDNGKEMEGINLLFNGRKSVNITDRELRKIIRILDKIEIHTFIQALETKAMIADMYFGNTILDKNSIGYKKLAATDKFK